MLPPQQLFVLSLNNRTKLDFSTLLVCPITLNSFFCIYRTYIWIGDYVRLAIYTDFFTLNVNAVT